MTSTKTVSQKERATLRSVVRQQFSVLRAQIRAREAQMESELIDDFNAQYASHDRDIEAVKADTKALIDEVNRDITDLARDLKDRYPHLKIEISDYNLAKTGAISVDDPDRRSRLAAAKAKIPMIVRQAFLMVNTQEADLLLGLAKDSLASDEARTFVESLPERREILPPTITLEAIEETVV